MEKVLRACINLGNPILARRDPATGTVSGLTVDLAHAFAARRPAAELELVVVETALEAVALVREQQVHFGFFAADPTRSEGVVFSPPIVLVESCYLVRTDSPLQSNDQVDAPGHRVVVGRGTGYEPFLRRTLKHARIVHAPATPSVVDVFLREGAEVAAATRRQLEADVRRVPGLRLLPGCFMAIEQAMACSAHADARFIAEMAHFVEDAKAQGLVAQSLARHGIDGATVAAPQPDRAAGAG